MIWLIPLLHGLGHLTFPIGKQLVGYADPIFTVGVRMLLAGLLLLGGLLLKGFQSIKISLKEAISLFILSLFSIYFNNLCEYLSLKYLSTAKTCFFYSMSPCVCVLISCLLSFIFFKREDDDNQMVGRGGCYYRFFTCIDDSKRTRSPFQNRGAFLLALDCSGRGLFLRSLWLDFNEIASQRSTYVPGKNKWLQHAFWGPTCANNLFFY